MKSATRKPRGPNRASPDFQKSDNLTSSDVAQNLKFERADWTSFRTIEGLQQKAGVAADKLRRLVLKELADNALDTGAGVKIGDITNGSYFIEDQGPGIDGAPEEIARLFSIARPMVSTKLLRLPTRGALGNGLRIVAGAVLASNGWLIVTTKNRRVKLRPERDGSTAVVSVKTVKFQVGTRVEIGFGEAIPEDILALRDARRAIMMARTGQGYLGKSSPWWYDVAHFHELLSASGDAPVRELVANLDGCTGARAGEIVAEAGLVRVVCRNVAREQAAKLLSVARQHARQVSPNRLGAVGPDVFPRSAYAVTTGNRHSSTAVIPFAVEAWAEEIDDEGDTETVLLAFVNRTPITSDIYASRDKRDIDIFGCGIHHTVAQAPRQKQFEIALNVVTPYMPITSDGKEPDLHPFLNAIMDVISKAVRKAQRPSGSKQSQKDVVLDNLDDVIAKVSGEECYRFNERQLFYALRPIVMDETGEELKIGNFKAIITDHEEEHGDIPLMYREPRGSITHPHRGETITLGTLTVEDYERPAWTFNKLLYIEKEGANEALKSVGWLERHDCAVMSSKGFSTRAAKDLIDKLAAHDEPVEVFCAHDADAYGTMIYQTLQEETKARRARKIKIINLGLEPWEALDMGLEVEDVEEGKRHKAVADYVRDHPNDDEDWEEWLQTHRVELNAMTTPQFIAWLDEKMAEHGSGKLIPPPAVLEDELVKRLERRGRADLTEQILREADFESRVAETMAGTTTPDASTLEDDIRELFEEKPESEWRDQIDTVVTALRKAKD